MSKERKEETTTIHVSDWNMNDRVLTVPRDKFIALVKVTHPKSVKKMLNAIYDMKTDLSGDPRASEMEGAEFFVDWCALDGVLAYHPEGDLAELKRQIEEAEEE